MTAEEAHDIIKTRYNELSQITDYITKRINRKIIKFLQYFHIIRAIHKHLYNGILINAGEFRKEDDKHGGRVHFGGMQHTEMKAYFDGFPPNILDKCVISAVLHLKHRTKTPIENSMRFYQKFVCCHPFYDANGRIARFIVGVYLNNFNLVINWEPFQDKRKFLKKLNECHKRMDKKDEFEEYFKYLADFVAKFTEDKDELINLPEFE